MERNALAPRIGPEQLDRSAVRSQQAEQQSLSRGLARAVRTEEPVRAARDDREVEPVEGADVAERLDDTRQGYDRAGHVVEYRTADLASGLGHVDEP